MDFNRAEEIFHSDSTYEVLYNNHPVWIQELNKEKHLAKISETNKENIEVPVNQLKEGKKLE